MSDPLIQLEGGRKLRKAFKDVGDDMSDMKALHRSLADDVAGTAKAKVPKRSGRLARSIRGSGTKTKSEVKAGNNRKSGPSSVPYAGRIHFGDPGSRTRGRIRPQPFLYDALDERQQDVLDRYNDEVRTIIKRVF